jgi:hypothetical protein
MYCEKSDSGLSVMAKPMSVSLRVLFNQTKSQFHTITIREKRYKVANSSHGYMYIMKLQNALLL